MVANTTPLFTLVPNQGCILSTGANTALDGSGSNVMTVLTAGVNGSTFENFHVKAKGTSTAGMIRIFLYNGTTYYLIHEIPVTAIAQSGTVATYEADWVPPNTLWTLKNGWSIVATTQNADAGYYFTATGGDF